MQALKFNLSQVSRDPVQSEMDAATDWIIVFNVKLGQRALGGFPYAQVMLERRGKLGITEPDREPVVMDLPNAAGSRVALACIKADLDAFNLLTLARKLVAVCSARKASTVQAAIAGFDRAAAERIAEAIIAATAAVAAQMPSFKHSKQPPVVLNSLKVFGIKARHGFRRTLAEAEGNAVARYLSMLPANKLTPALYQREIKKLAADYGWKQEFLNEQTLRRRKAGAFLAVAQGSPTRDAGIMRLVYKPARGMNRKGIALVGKGICYDTGGTNLKPAKHMFGMHEDMQGSAVALGTLIALTRLQVNYPVECWLALASNHIGPHAYKPNDVVIASDGTTIEIVHTDAEGRMVLADTLALASQKQPGLLIDYATLTGACVYSLGTAYSGVFTNREAFHPVLIDAGKDSGERVWPFPMDEDYDKELESPIADVKQCSLEGGGDHILAARFLQRFIKEKTPWIHVDLAASSHKGGLAHIPTDTTGFGVRFTLNLLLDKKPVRL
jgi:leucyl aminopeptidase